MAEQRAEHPGDPRRRFRRHRYQEGPGFLFLATQGGRPPIATSRASLQEVRLRMRAVRLANGAGLDLAVAGGYSRRSVFRWMQLYNSGGITALQPKSRASREPHPAGQEWLGVVNVANRFA